MRNGKADNLDATAPGIVRGLLSHAGPDDPTRRRKPAHGLNGNAAAAAAGAGSGEAVSSPAWETVVSLPKRIGKYTIVRQIAEGGMGIVFEATQDEPVRSVALKVLKPGLIAGANLKRFQTEAQILADLRHDHIAQVYEAGVHHDAATGLAVAYFAMEYIPAASTLTQFAAHNELSVAERLRLFLDVLSAVGAAHKRDIVHRDLKPSNILVDANGVVKVIDFGVARTNDQSHAVATQAGMVIGTLEFMSPEQIGDQARVLDTRSDVYTLGIILHLLLADEMPYEVSRTDVTQAATTVLNVHPKPLPRLPVSSPKDLSTIIACAMIKDRRRRLPSVEKMASEIERYLEGKPIDSRRDTIYRLGRNAQRFLANNRILAFFMAVLVAGLVTHFAVVPVAFRFTRLGGWVEDAMASVSAPSLASFDHVAVVEIRDGTDFEALARTLNISGVSNEDTVAGKGSRRLLHAALLRRFVSSGCTAVGLDIMYRGESHETDAKLRAAMSSLIDQGIPVAIAQPHWFGDGNSTEPPVDPAFLATPRLLLGGISFDNDPALPMVNFAMQRKQTALVPSLAACLWGASRLDTTNLTYQFDHEHLRLVISPSDHSAPWDNQISAPVSYIGPVSLAVPAFGVEADDLSASVPFSLATAPIREAATIGLTEALLLDEESFVKRFNGRIVLLGDAREPPGKRSDIHTIQGQRVAGVWVHAATLEGLCRGRTTSYLQEAATLILTFVVAALGAAITLSRMPWGTKVLAALVIAGAAVAVSAVVYSGAGYFVNPLPVIASFFLGTTAMMILYVRPQGAPA